MLRDPSWLQSRPRWTAFPSNRPEQKRHLRFWHMASRQRDSRTLMVTGLCVPSRLHCPSSPGVEREDVIAKARRPRLLKPGSLLGLNTPRKSCICFPKPGRGISAPKRDPGRWPLAALSGAANGGQLWMTTEDPLGFDSTTV